MDVIPSNSCNVRGECCLTESEAAFLEMLAFAETISSSSSLSNTTSPQYKAVEWLAQDKVDNDSNWSGYELLQRYVLRVLYHSTGGDNWSNTASTSWFVGGSSVCDWGSSDAQCNGNGEQVDFIFLGSDNLRGTIPDELGQLTALTNIDLFDNLLTGTIPTQLGKLTALETLDLRENHLTGTIPTQLGELTALYALSLRSNQLTGTIPLALTQLINLNRLYLYNNNLTGQVPSGFCAAPFPDWRFDGAFGNNALHADCMAEVQCDCCDVCYDERGNGFCWNGSGFGSC